MSIIFEIQCAQHILSQARFNTPCLITSQELVLILTTDSTLLNFLCSLLCPLYLILIIAGEHATCLSELNIWYISHRSLCPGQHFHIHFTWRIYCWRANNTTVNIACLRKTTHLSELIYNHNFSKAFLFKIYRC